jgi:23S rRNA pseudouridine955/2504/2580 synthase
VKNIIGGNQPAASAQTGTNAQLPPISGNLPSLTGAIPPATPPAKASLIAVDSAYEGQRLDNFLLRELKGVPQTHIYRIIRSGEVRVNKGRAQADTRLAAGDLVRLPPVRVSERIQDKIDKPAPARNFPILFEDDYFLAIDKPAGVAVHGGSGVSFGVIEQLRMARPLAKYLELVHRIDRDTSGILLIAKRRSSLVHLQEQFKNRETGKTYLALVQGAWLASKKVIDQPLHKFLVDGGDDDGERRVKVVAKDDPNGMRAITLVKIARPLSVKFASGTVQAFTLLEVTIKTGRTHQIRVHLASNGHPIVGDDKYGDFELNKQLAKQNFKRMFLHAWKLSIAHPATQAEMHLQSKLPADLATAWGLGLLD